MARSRVVEIVLKAKDEASSKVGKFADKLGISKGALVALGAAATAAAAVTVAAFKKMVDAAARLVQETSDLGDQFDKMSARTSLSVEDLSEWQFLMERAGGTAGNLEASIRRLTKSMYDKSVGLSTAVRAWEQLGIETENADGSMRDVHSVLLDLADALSESDDMTRSLGMSQDVLGRGAAQMVALLSQGRPELERQIALFHRLNGTMGEDYTDGAAAVIDAQTDLKWAIRAIKRELTEPVLNAVAENIDEIAIAAGDLSKWVDANKDDLAEFANNMATVAKAFIVTTTALGKLTADEGPKLLKFLEFVDPKFSNFMAQLRAAGFATEFLASKLDDAAASGEQVTKGPLFGEQELVGPIDEETLRTIAAERAAAVRAALEKAAKDLDVDTSVSILDPETAQWIDIPKTSEKLAEEIVKARDAALKKVLASAPELPREFVDAFTLPLDDNPMDALIPTDDELQGLLDFGDSLGRSADEIQRIKDTGDEALASLVEGARDAAETQELLKDAGRDVTFMFERMASESISAFLNGEAGAMKFGTLLRTVVIDALSAVITKLITIKLLSKALGPLGFKDGGTVPGVRTAAFGYSVPMTPGGKPGMDSVPIMAMPGEEVIDRSLSQQLRRFLAAQGSSYVDPTTLPAQGRGGSPSVVLQVARPVGYLDMLDLGNAAAVAGRKVTEAEL